MKETSQIPMLFSAAMVRAILGGHKTETRRIVKPQGGTYFEQVQMPSPDFKGWETDVAHKGGPTTVICGPQVGDLIWGKEAFRFHSIADLVPPRLMQAGSGIEYIADGQKMGDLSENGGFVRGRNRASMHLPKVFSRFTLPVLEYRVERLQEIDAVGAIAEGIIDHRNTIIGAENAGGFHREITADGYHWVDDWELGEEPEFLPTARDAYADLWDNINGAGSWDSDPWVSVTRFDVIRDNVLAVAA